MNLIQTAILHYSAPPVVGGVEAVIYAHAATMLEAGYPVSVIAGRGDKAALPAGTEFVRIAEIDSQHPAIIEASQELERGRVPDNFDDLVTRIAEKLAPLLNRFDNAIFHNLFTKHFNLPLTAALFRLLDQGQVRHAIAWCHDFTWTSPNSRTKVFPGYPWDLLRTYHAEVDYVVVSQKRQRELADLYGCPLEKVQVIFNGVDPNTLLGLSEPGQALVKQLDLLKSDLILLMPVRITQAKNIEYALRVVAALKSQAITQKLVLTGPPDPHDDKSMEYYRGLKALRRQLQVEEETCFVFESGSDPHQPFTIDARVVGDLFRVSDIMFMPSHREGFGMPVLEAGLSGIQVMSTEVPAALEIGGEDIILFSTSDEPDQVASQIQSWMGCSPIYRLRRRVRQNYTWQALFRHEIELLLQAGKER